MTLGEGKRKVLMLLDEYSSGGEITVDSDINKKMADFFDIAQKEMAGYKRIIRCVTLKPDSTAAGYDLPERFADVFRVWKNGYLTNRYAVIDGKIVFPQGDTMERKLEYFAHPMTITPETPDDYEFEVAEDAANCLPFFVAAQHLLVDLVVDYSALWNIYLAMRSALDTSLPASGGGGVRQALFRR